MSRNAKLSMLLLALSPLAAAAPIRAQETAVAHDAIEQDLPDDFYCGERKLGQWFYCTRPKPPESAANSAPELQASAAQRLSLIHI